jgi:hypothetical protein
LSWEDELQRLARDREVAYESSLSRMIVDEPGMLRRQLRTYLGMQTDYRKLKRTYDDAPRLNTIEGGFQELVCEEIEFQTDSRLSFRILMEPNQTGWLVKRFEFDLYLARRSINMIRIHLNQEAGRDPLRVPRCHFHVGNSKAHIPFPIMSPRLMLPLICEDIEADVGL